jgi:outer membrane biosynthesis protein TonB
MNFRRCVPYATSILVHYSIFQYIIKEYTPIKPIEVSIIEKSTQLKSEPSKKQPKLDLMPGKKQPKLDLMPNNTISKLDSFTGQHGVAKKTQSSIGDSQQRIFDTDKEVYASFFNRIHNQLDVVWHSKVEPYIQTYQTKNRVRIASKRTKLLITLDSVGHVLSVTVLLESNSEIIDAFATNSFKELAFFPNPPKELIKDGKIVFDWEFVIY